MLTARRDKVIKIGAKVVRHGRFITFQLAEVAIPRALFAGILHLIDCLRSAPLPPWRVSIWKQLGLPTEELRLVSVEVRPPITRLLAQRPFHHKIDQ